MSTLSKLSTQSPSRGLEEERTLVTGLTNLSHLKVQDSPHAYVGPFSFREDNMHKMSKENYSDGEENSDLDSDEDEYLAKTQSNIINGVKRSVSNRERKVPTSLKMPNRVPINEDKEEESQFAAITPKGDQGSLSEFVIEDQQPTTKELEDPIPLSDLDPVENLREFVRRPVLKGALLKCRITRNRRGMDRGMYPIYFMHLEREDDKKVFLLAGRKRKKSATSNYLISVDPCDLSRTGDSYVAKVRSNLVGTQFTIFDNGVSVHSTASLKDSSSANNLPRQELGAVLYETNVLGFKGPRKMTVVVPYIPDHIIDSIPNSTRNSQSGDQFQLVFSTSSLIERFKKGELENFHELRNKTPVWNEETQSYVLNFHGRVTMASVKNFQIVCNNDVDDVVMQFGRVAENIFTLDFSYPLSPIQAFGIALTSFDGKLACE